MTTTNEKPTQLPSLPSADDSSWVGAWASVTNQLQRLRGYILEGRPVWWRRDPFRGELYADVAPKWHVFTGRVRSADPDDRWSFTWSALCDFQHNRPEILSGACDFKVTPPKKDTRCKRCDAALKEIKKLTAEVVI